MGSVAETTPLELRNYRGGQWKGFVPEATLSEVRDYPVIEATLSEVRDYWRWEMGFVAGLIVGLVVGGCVGALVMAWCAAAGKADRRMGREG